MRRLSQPGTDRERRDKVAGLKWRERQTKKRRENKRGCVDKRAQLVKPSMSNFAKTDVELRPACALLILTTCMRIKEHLLTN